jgi:undecaprenyl diphosphate synthase
MRSTVASGNGIRPAETNGGPPAGTAGPGAAPSPFVACGPVPRHVAIIMDGNGRWAKQRGLSRKAGHDAGAENLRRVIHRMAEAGVECLTLYAFSTENWGRPKQEVGWLLRMPGRFIKRELRELHENGIRLRHLGRLDRLSRSLQKQVREAEQLTANNTRMTVCIAFNYGGRAEIVDAVRALVAEGVRPEQIDEEAIAAHLYTAGLPDPDLIVRTAGEMRLSNFLMWQSAYSEYYVSPVYWPDFDEREVDRALAAFGGRERRYGRRPDQDADARV